MILTKKTDSSVDSIFGSQWNFLNRTILVADSILGLDWSLRKRIDSVPNLNSDYNVDWTKNDTCKVMGIA